MPEILARKGAFMLF